MRQLTKRWPLLVIGASAGAATWSGWVGLGKLTGFGVVNPLPGIADHIAINTAVTLPIGVEAYAVYALSVATSERLISVRARGFAWRSAAAALGLGMAGQVAYHLMAAAGVSSAPWWIVAMVSCMPVLVLGAASYLWHLTSIEPLDPVESTKSIESSPEVDPIESIEPGSSPPIESIRSSAEVDPIEQPPLDPRPVEAAGGSVLPHLQVVKSSEPVEPQSIEARAEDVERLKAAVEAEAIQWPVKIEPARKYLRIHVKYVKAAVRQLEIEGWTPSRRDQEQSVLK